MNQSDKPAPPVAARQWAALRWPAAERCSLTFRTVADCDLPFLAQLYASTRADEMAVVPWSDVQKTAFLDMQFRAQHAHYKQHFSDAAWMIVERDGAPIGRLYLDCRGDEHRVIDIALLPLWRGRGFGAALMQDVIAQASADGKPVRIHVEQNNPARHLYDRLGFRKIDSYGIYDLLEHAPGQVNIAS